MDDLDKTFKEERRVGIDESVAKLEEEHALQSDKLRLKHGQELKDLDSEGLSSEEYQQRKAQVFNEQQLQLSALERKQNEEMRKLKTSATADWEVRYARAKLELKEKHYEEYADALSELSPDQSDAHKQAVEKALEAARELEEIKKKLEEEKQRNDDRQRLENEEFEKEQKRRMEENLNEFEIGLQNEEEEERKKNEKVMLSLTARKEDLLKERKMKVKQQIAKMSQQGASKNEKDALLKEHSDDLARLMNKLDADRMRMQSSLEERLRKKRHEKRKVKINELEKAAEEEKREHESKQQAEIERLQAAEVLRLKESIQVDDLVATTRQMEYQTPQSRKPSQPPLPVTYRMAAPLTESEITSLLLQSPLYQKLENIKTLIHDGKREKIPNADTCYTDIKDDTLWSSDEMLVPVDLNKIPGRTFVVYKFGCFIVDLLTIHCQFCPVTLLLAEKLPPNPELFRNAYRNSFYYDSNNNILYMRKERLENVGEFVLVLIHCLAHLKIQDLRDDAEPSFVKEFHRGLAIVCDDLFFARYRRSTVSPVLSENDCIDRERNTSGVLRNNAEEGLDSIMRRDVVGDFLDLKLLRGTSKDGVHFSREGLIERLSKYSNFALSNKIQDLLGDPDDKSEQAQIQGTNIFIEDRLRELQSSVRPLSRFAQSRGNLVSSDTARECSRGVAVSRSTTPYPASKKRSPSRVKSCENEDFHTSFLQIQVDDIQEKVDYLNEEFSDITLQLLHLSNNLEEAETEFLAKTDELKNLDEGSAEYANRKQLYSLAAINITAKKNMVETLEVKKQSCLERLELFRKQLERKAIQLAQYDIEKRQKVGSK